MYVTPRRRVKTAGELMDDEKNVVKNASMTLLVTVILWSCSLFFLFKFFTDIKHEKPLMSEHNTVCIKGKTAKAWIDTTLTTHYTPKSYKTDVETKLCITLENDERTYCSDIGYPDFYRGIDSGYTFFDSGKIASVIIEESKKHDKIGKVIPIIGLKVNSKPIFSMNDFNTIVQAENKSVNFDWLTLAFITFALGFMILWDIQWSADLLRQMLNKWKKRCLHD